MGADSGTQAPSPRPDGPSPEAHGTELVHRARASALLISVTALIVVPAWSAFDFALEPDHARTFTTLRLVCDLPILLAVWVLWRRRPRRPERVAVAVLAVVQCEIAWMVSRAGESRPFYLLGFTLALYASGLLLAGPPAWTLLLAAVTATAFAVCLVVTPDAVGTSDLLAAAFYLGTASIIAVLAHMQRDRLTTREFVARGRLEQEQELSRDLMLQLRRQSHEDALTGVANRRRWDERLHEECERAHSGGGDLSVVLLDVDRFKEINDSYGHAGGDETLRQVAAVLTHRVSADGLVARLGGDELAVLLPGKGSREAMALAERVRKDVRRCVALGSPLVVTVSLGVATARGAEAAPSALMQQADRALYGAKGTRDAVGVAGASSAAETGTLPVPRAELPDGLRDPALAHLPSTEAPSS
jgi:diguanylate cyclase (GGDEF)-like protein